jgi:hypothetical protein
MPRQGLPTPRRGGAGGGVEQHADTQDFLTTPPLSPLPFASEWEGSRYSQTFTSINPKKRECLF